MKYRKKPIVVEAEQWPVDEPEGFQGIDGVIWQNQRLEIHTLEGVHEVTPGDWIITGIQGEKYPCKPDIFEETYEEVIGAYDHDGYPDDKEG